MEEIKKVITENIIGPNSPNVATTDENITVDEIFQQSSIPSLGRQIFSVIPTNGPTAALFSIRKKTGTTNFEIVRSDVLVEPSKSIKSGLTQEVIQDIRAQFGKEANSIIGKLLRGLANDQENTATLAFLDVSAAPTTDLHLTDALNAETNLFEITQKVHELILKINSKNMRSYEAFAVIPYQALGGIMGLSHYIGGDKKEGRGLFITKAGLTKFYINPNAESNTAYVGLKDMTNSSKSSATFSPFRSTVIDTIDPDTGENVYHIYNRFGITLSPLNESGNEMIHKFEILL